MKVTNEQSEKIVKFAKELGFDLIGFTKPQISPVYIKAFKNWLKEGYEGSMKYMRKTGPRENPKQILKDAKSVIVFGVNYYYEQKPLKNGYGRIARYAYGRDYHKIIKKALQKLENFIAEILPEAKTKSYVDTGPILERAFAVQAGLGKIGKNSCLITKEFGSWIFLAVIITNLKFPDSPAKNCDPGENSAKKFPLCGTCTRCIDSCPTKAIIAPGMINAGKCISYHTIENKGKIPLKIAGKIAKTTRIFGCDICQEVCPHNMARQKTIKNSKDPIRESLKNPKIAGTQLNLKKIRSIKTDEEFLKVFAGSPLMRAKRKGLHKAIHHLTYIHI